MCPSAVKGCIISPLSHPWNTIGIIVIIVVAVIGIVIVTKYQCISVHQLQDPSPLYLHFYCAVLKMSRIEVLDQHCWFSLVTREPQRG